MALADAQSAGLLARLRRRTRLPALLALSAFALRALVPTGFMIMPVDGHLQWTLCPDAGAPAPGATAAIAMDGIGASAHAHHHQHAGLRDGAHGAGMPGHESQPHCPFALASAAPLAGPLPAVLEPWSVARVPMALAGRAGRAADVPLRHSAARGPPTLA